MENEACSVWALGSFGGGIGEWLPKCDSEILMKEDLRREVNLWVHSRDEDQWGRSMVFGGESGACKSSDTERSGDGGQL